MEVDNNTKETLIKAKTHEQAIAELKVEGKQMKPNTSLSIEKEIAVVTDTIPAKVRKLEEERVAALEEKNIYYSFSLAE